MQRNVFVTSVVYLKEKKEYPPVSLKNSQKYWEVNQYKKVATFCKLFLCIVVDQQGVHHFLFISNKHIVKSSKKSMLQNNIYKIVYLLYSMIF